MNSNWHVLHSQEPTRGANACTLNDSLFLTPRKGLQLAIILPFARIRIIAHATNINTSYRCTNTVCSSSPAASQEAQNKLGTIRSVPIYQKLPSINASRNSQILGSSWKAFNQPDWFHANIKDKVDQKVWQNPRPAREQKPKYPIFVTKKNSPDEGKRERKQHSKQL